MKILASAVLVIVGIIIGMLCSIGAFIYGWGLEPKSWFWIIGIYFVGNVVAVGITEIAKSLLKDED